MKLRLKEKYKELIKERVIWKILSKTNQKKEGKDPN
jgi:hypothetical protein